MAVFANSQIFQNHKPLKTPTPQTAQISPATFSVGQKNKLEQIQEENGEQGEDIEDFWVMMGRGFGVVFWGMH